jgi:oligopeptide/dipeptide ABC transporter ATP-binding protein
MTMLDTSALLSVTDLRKEFHRTRRGDPVVAVRDVSLELRAGETLAVVGESGSGKSTLGRMILGLLPPTGGRISFEGEDITHVSGKARRALSKDIQVIFQDPYASLNPRRRVEDTIREPLDIHGVGTTAQRRERVTELMDMVALAQRYRNVYPHELSGGLRQRVGIATALALRPKVIVADEPVSALDVSVQAQILDLLTELRRETAVALLFISHDLGVVHQIGDRVAVMCQGELIEQGPVEAVYAVPQHPYSAALLSAIPPADPAATFDPIIIGESRTLAETDPGCRFRQRCWLAEDVCATAYPGLTPRPGGVAARCHISERSPEQWFTRDGSLLSAGVED